MLHVSIKLLVIPSLIECSTYFSIYLYEHKYFHGPVITFIFSACPKDQIRFGPYCYFELDTPSQTLYENANQCEDQESYLWYPETEAEIKFIKHKFPTPTNDDVYHLGFTSYNGIDGLRTTNNNTIPGIRFYTSKVIKVLRKIIM